MESSVTPSSSAEDELVGLSPPKYRNLAAWKPDNRDLPQKVWEIGVSGKHSLPWCIFLSYMVPPAYSNHEEFCRRLQLLLGDENEMLGIQKKKNLRQGKIDPNTIEQRLKTFNPFKNRHISFFDDQLIQIFRIFDLRLKRYANARRGRNEVWNDDVKLREASRMLECTINIYLPEEKDGENFVCYSKQTSSTPSHIILFEYKDVKYKNRKEAINIFHFAMSNEIADSLRQKALNFIFKKAKVPPTERLMGIKDSGRENFLISLFSSPNVNCILYLYKSPYIVQKLSEAGFESDPISVDSAGVSVLCHAMTYPDTRFLRILYDYAANCCQIPEGSIRNPNDIIIDRINYMGEIMKNDMLKTNEFKTLLHSEEEREQPLLIAQGFSHFNKYQSEISTNIKRIRNKIERVANIEKMKGKSAALADDHKELILSIFGRYENYFFCEIGSTEDFSLVNYIKFSEYYENLDNLTCLLFLDNLFSLKLIQNEACQLTPEKFQMYEDMEKHFFLLALSNKFFPKHSHKLHCVGCGRNTNDCEQAKNALRFIPYSYRLILKERVSTFGERVEQLNSVGDKSEMGKTQSKKKGKGASAPKFKKGDLLRGSLSALPEVIDEMWIFKLKTQVRAVSEVSVKENPNIAALVIERALQVLGEALKPRTTSKCIVSDLLCSCLPQSLIDSIIKLRNDFLSHSDKVSLAGRMQIETKADYFTSIQNEIKLIGEALEPVYKSQELRVEKFLIEIGIEVAENNIQHKNLVSELNKASENTNLIRNKRYDQNKTKHVTLYCNFVKYFEKCLKEIKQNMGKSKTLNIKRTLQSKTWALHYLSEQMLQHCGREPDRNMIENIEHCNDIFLLCEEKPIPNAVIDKIKKILTNFRNILIDIFDIEPERMVTNQKYSTINNMLQEFKSFSYFTEEEKKCIKEKIEEEIKINKIALNAREKIEEMFSKNSLKCSDYFDIVEKINISSKLKKKLFNLMIQKLRFFLERIKVLKEILIEDDKEIKQMWTYGKSAGIKQHSKFLMVQRYVKETDIRASLEAVLLDCLEMLTNRDDLARLWKKSDYLFSGVNLRDFLAHGNPLIESACQILDPEDLPSEFINKILELIEDSEMIQVMLDTCKKHSVQTKDELKKIMNSPDAPQWIRNNIPKNYERWESYVFLMPVI